MKEIAEYSRFMKGKKGFTLRGCASIHFILLELMLRTFWAQKYTHCAWLRSVCHELQAYLSLLEIEDPASLSACVLGALFPFGCAHEVVGWPFFL